MLVSEMHCHSALSLTGNVGACISSGFCVYLDIVVKRPGALALRLLIQWI